MEAYLANLLRFVSGPRDGPHVAQYLRLGSERWEQASLDDGAQPRVARVPQDYEGFRLQGHRDGQFEYKRTEATTLSIEVYRLPSSFITFFLHSGLTLSSFPGRPLNAGSILVEAWEEQPHGSSNAVWSYKWA